MEIKPVVLVLADISGYTRFVKMHRLNVIHAEGIVTDLLESVIASTGLPLVVHELEGDAVAFYAVDDGPESYANIVFEHVERFMEAFRRREAELLSECTICACDACKTVGKLRIKVVLHRGQAVFGALRQFTKIAGEDVILAHRLLKNTVPSNEYILMTEPFLAACPPPVPTRSSGAWSPSRASARLRSTFSIYSGTTRSPCRAGFARSSAPSSHSKCSPSSGFSSARGRNWG